MLAAATDGWPEAAVAIAGIALVASVAIVAVWQLLATWRQRMGGTREADCRPLAEQRRGGAGTHRRRSRATAVRSAPRDRLHGRVRPVR
jgi:hypothetical protein